jgi:hypothetical protein
VINGTYIRGLSLFGLGLSCCLLACCFMFLLQLDFRCLGLYAGLWLVPILVGLCSGSEVG